MNYCCTVWDSPCTYITFTIPEKMIASSFSIIFVLVDYIAVPMFVFETNKLPINNSLVQFHASFVCSLKRFRNHQI